MRKSSQRMAGGGVYALTKTVDGRLIFLPLLSQEVSPVILDSRVEIHLNLGKQVFVCSCVGLELCEANENAAFNNQEIVDTGELIRYQSLVGY